MRQTLVAVLLAMPSLASAAAPQAHLLYVREAGAERCPDEQTMRSTVAARLKREPFSERAFTTVSVTLQANGPGLRARIELVDGAGEVAGSRELTSRRRDCADLAPAVALAISIAIDPLAFAGPTEPTDATTPTTTPATNANVAAATSANAAATSATATATSANAAVTSATAAATSANGAATSAPTAQSGASAAPSSLSKEAPADRRRLRARLGAGALLSLGSAPDVAYGFTVSGGVRGRTFSAELELRADLPAGESGDKAAGGHVDTALYAAAIVPCFHLNWFAGCALVQLGAQVSRGSDYPLSHEVATFYAAAGVRAAIEVPLGRRLEAQVGADLLAPITRTVLLADETPVFTTPSVSGAFHLAMLGNFP